MCVATRAQACVFVCVCGGGGVVRGGGVDESCKNCDCVSRSELRMHLNGISTTF